MPPFSIVKAVDVPGEVALDVAGVAPLGVVFQLELERREEALGDRVVPAVALAGLMLTVMPADDSPLRYS